MKVRAAIPVMDARVKPAHDAAETKVQ